MINAALELAEKYAYDAYGNMVPGAGLTADPASALTSILYSGEQTDATGLQYLRSRYYNPANGRFNRLDPFAGSIQDPLSLHKYLYANGNGVNFTDPTGKWSLGAVSVGITIAAAIAGITAGADTGSEGTWWEGFIPGWGSGRGLGASIHNGDGLRIAWNSIFLGLDIFTAGAGKLFLKGAGTAPPAVAAATKDEVWGLFKQIITVTEDPAFLARARDVFSNVDLVLAKLRSQIADYLVNPTKQLGFGKGITAWIDESRLLIGNSSNIPGLWNTAKAIRHELSHGIDLLRNPEAFAGGLKGTSLVNLLKSEYRAYYVMGHSGAYSVVLAMGSSILNKFGIQASTFLGREALWAAGNYAVPYLINAMYDQ